MFCLRWILHSSNLNFLFLFCGPMEHRKLKEWVVDCQKKKKQLSREMVWEEAIKMDPCMFGGRNAEGWTIKMSRWYYKFLQREHLSIKDKETGGRGRPRSKLFSELVSWLYFSWMQTM